MDTCSTKESLFSNLILFRMLPTRLCRLHAFLGQLIGEFCLLIGQLYVQLREFCLFIDHLHVLLGQKKMTNW